MSLRHEVGVKLTFEAATGSAESGMRGCGALSPVYPQASSALKVVTSTSGAPTLKTQFLPASAAATIAESGSKSGNVLSGLVRLRSKRIFANAAVRGRSSGRFASKV